MKRSPIRRTPKPKYGNRRCWSNLTKRWFDSAAEMRYGDHLFARQCNGEIRDLEFQVNVPLVIGGVRLGLSRVDFKYYEHRWRGQQREQWVWDEFKGFETDVWKLKKKLWAAGGGPGMLRVTKANKNRSLPYTFEEIWPAGVNDA